MKKISDKILKENIFFDRAENGMPIYVWPKRGLRKKFAFVGVRYGGTNNSVRFPSDDSPVDMPGGVAHFLEHSLFNVRGKDISEKFSALGASVNAMTSFTDTVYFFSCTEGFDRAARLLLGFVGRPSFDVECVEREKQIITQEILMSSDNPDWRAFFGLMRSLYKRHPVRIDIAGTVDSVNRIDAETLRFCHRSFYRPDNMIFVAAGDMRPADVLRIANSASRRKYRAGRRPEKIEVKEPSASFKKTYVEQMQVSRPKYLMGFKESTDGLDAGQRFRRVILTGVLLDAIFGTTSQLYNSLYNRGLVDDTFGVSCTSGDDFAYTIMGGDVDKPDLLTEAIFEGIAVIKKRGIDADEFRRKKRKALGGFLRHFNSSESCATVLGNFILQKANIFEYLPILLGLKVADAEERLREHLRRGVSATSVILPRRKAAGKRKPRRR